MPDKLMHSSAQTDQARSRQAPPHQDGPRPTDNKSDAGDASLPRDARHDDGITNPRDGRGPLRRCDDQAAKLPLRPPH